MAWVGASLLVATSAAAAPDGIVYSEDPDLDRLAHSFWRGANSPDTDIDSANYGKPIPKRPLIGEGWYRTPFGVQVDPNCFRSAHLSRKELERRFDGYIASAVKSVSDYCENTYPELGDYFAEWEQKLARTAITCTTKQDNDVEAFNLKGMSAPSRFMELSEYDRLKHLPTFVNDPVASNLPVIVLPPAALNGAVGTSHPSTFTVGTLVHEAFHSTRANNRIDHNSVETVLRQPGCKDDASVDRITVLESLCSGDELGPLNGTAQDALYARMIDPSPNCNRKTACENVFTSSFGKGPMGGARSRGEFDVGSLCDRIFNEGCCRSQILNDGGGYKALLNGPEVKPVADRVMARMDQVLPHGTGELPAALIGAYPDIAAQFASLAGTPCFKAQFSGSLESGLVANTVPNNPLSGRDRWDYAPNGFRSTLASLVQKIKSDPRCGSDGPALVSALSELDGTAGIAFQSPTFMERISTRATLGYEKSSPIGSGSHYLKEENALLMLLDGQSVQKSVFSGKSLYYEYNRAINEHHPESARFSCAKLSISEYAILGCLSKLQAPAAVFCPK
jgi:hypothetical protein